MTRFRARAAIATAIAVIVGSAVWVAYWGPDLMPSLGRSRAPQPSSDQQQPSQDGSRPVAAIQEVTPAVAATEARTGGLSKNPETLDSESAVAKLGAAGRTETPGLSDLPANELLGHFFEATPGEQREILKNMFRNRENALKELRQWAQTGTASQKKVACKLLRKARDKGAEPALLEALKDPNPDVQEQAIQALRFVGGATGAQAIRETMEPASYGGVIRAGLAALGELGYAEDTARIAPYLQHETESVRLTAAVALAMLGDTKGKAMLLAGSKSDYSYFRTVATRGLGYIADAESVARLQEEANDAKPCRQDQARIAMATQKLRAPLGKADQEAVLVRLAKEGGPEAGKWAVEKIIDLGADDAATQLTGIAKAGCASSVSAAEQLLLSYGMDPGIEDSAEALWAKSADGPKHELDTHIDLTEAALKLLAKQSPDSVPFYRGYPSAPLEPELHTELGSKDEDLQTCDNEKCDSAHDCAKALSALNHFYDPGTMQGLTWHPWIPGFARCDEAPIQRSAPDSAVWHWGELTEAFHRENLLGYNNFYHLLGQALHLVEDMTSPAHVHLPGNHIANFGDDFEAWSLQAQKPQPYNSVVGLWMAQEPSPFDSLSVEPLASASELNSPDGFMHRLAEFTKRLSNFAVHLAASPDRQRDINFEPDNELAHMFDLAYQDGLLDTCWTLQDEEGQDIGQFGPSLSYDRIADGTCPLLGGYLDAWWPESGYSAQKNGNIFELSGPAYIENTDSSYYILPLVRKGKWHAFVPHDFSQSKLQFSTYTKGDSLLLIYARELFPQAVRYAAGVLQYAAQYLPSSMPVARVDFNGSVAIDNWKPPFVVPTLTGAGEITLTLVQQFTGASVEITLDNPGWVISREPQCLVELGSFVDGPHELWVAVTTSSNETVVQRIPFLIDSSTPAIQQELSRIWTPVFPVTTPEVVQMALGSNVSILLVVGSPSYDWAPSVYENNRHVFRLRATAPGNGLQLWNRDTDTGYFLSGAYFGDSQLIFTAVVSDGGNYWVGTNKGVMRFSVQFSQTQGPLITGKQAWNKSNGLVGDWVTSLSVRPNSQNIVVGIRGSEYCKVTPDADRREWTNPGGVSEWSPGVEWNAGYPAIRDDQGNWPNVAGAEVTEVAGYGASECWAASDLGLNYCSSIRVIPWNLCGPVSGWESERTLCLAPEGSNAVILGTTKGLAFLKYDQWSYMAKEYGSLPGTRVADALLDEAAGLLWVATDEGVASRKYPSGSETQEWWRYTDAGPGPAYDLVLAQDGLVWGAVSDGTAIWIGYFSLDVGVRLDVPTNGAVFVNNSPGPRSVELKWTGPPNAEAFEVFLDDISIGRAPGNSRTVDLEPGEYTWTVRSIFKGDKAGPKAEPSKFRIVYASPPEGVEFALIRPEGL